MGRHKQIGIIVAALPKSKYKSVKLLQALPQVRQPFMYMWLLAQIGMIARYRMDIDTGSEARLPKTHRLGD